MGVIVLIACFSVIIVELPQCSIHSCTETQLTKVTTAHSFNISEKQNHCLK